MFSSRVILVKMEGAPRRFVICELVGWQGELGACPLSGDNCVRAECTCTGCVCQRRGYLRFDNKKIRKLKIVRKCSGDDVTTVVRPSTSRGVKRSLPTPSAAETGDRHKKPQSTPPEVAEEVFVSSSSD